MNLFYYSEIQEPITILPEEESKHIVRVLRKNVGDIIHFTDGKGNMFRCIITDDHPKRCSIEINEKYIGDDHRNYYLHIAIAPTKNINRTEWFLEKATEIGIDKITPIITFHSERKDIKLDRLNKVVIAAVKQSLKSKVPQLSEIMEFNKLLDMNFKGDKFIAYIDNEIVLELSQAYKPGRNALILIGPEGDFSPEEVEMAKAKGFVPVSLGKSRLRTETAGIVACHTISLANG